MKVKNATPELIQEVLQSLKGNEQKFACDLHELEQTLNLKVELNEVIRKKTSTYIIVYSTKKPLKVLFKIKINILNDTKETTFAVKANLFHVAPNLIESSPEKIKKSIKRLNSCGKCSQRCFTKKTQYIIDGIEYDPCFNSNNWFADFETTEWNAMKNFIVYEHHTHLNS